MRRKTVSRVIRGLLGAVGGGLLFAASCSNEALQAAVLAGVDAATDELVNATHNDTNDVSFLDWVESELDD